MLQDEALHFLRIGTFLERADNTARLLDVKFQRLAGDVLRQRHEPGQRPGQTQEVQEVDFYHWSAVLRSVSGFEVYRKVYRNVIRPEKVAELLILRPDMPRSLAACMNEVVANLTLVANAAERRDAAPRRPAAQRPAVRPHRRDPGHRPACLPDAVPRPRRRPRRRHQPRLPGADGGLGARAALAGAWRPRPAPGRLSGGARPRRYNRALPAGHSWVAAAPHPGAPRHDQVCLCHRRCGVVPGQGHRVGVTGGDPRIARPQGHPDQARSLPQRGSGHDEPVPARRGVRHRRRRRDRPRPRPLRALHHDAHEEVEQLHHRPDLQDRCWRRSAGAITWARRCR